MINISNQDCDEVNFIMHELQNMPYGKELRNKTLRPNANHFAKGVDKLIDIFSLYVNEENIQIIENIRSLRANQIRELLLKTDSSFEKLGINIQMEDIYNELRMHVRSFLALTQIQKLNFKGS